MEEEFEAIRKRVVQRIANAADQADPISVPLSELGALLARIAELEARLAVAGRLATAASTYLAVSLVDDYDTGKARNALTDSLVEWREAMGEEIFRASRGRTWDERTPEDQARFDYEQP